MTVFTEPPRTRFDIRFKLGRIPVRIHPFFWLSTFGLTLGSNTAPMQIAIWVLAVLISILVHELGHAVAFRRFGCESRITLYGFGGLASAEPGRKGSPAGWSRIIVSAAGPFAGFALGGLVIGAVLVSGHQAPFMTWTVGSGPALPNLALFTFVADMMFINVIWGLVNLLPVHPLDGGDIALELARKHDPRRGVERSVWLSFFVAIMVGGVALIVFHDVFVLLMFGYLAVMSWMVLRTRYGASAQSLRVVRWFRAKKVARRLDLAEREKPTAEVDKVVRDLFDRVEKSRTKRR